MSKAKETKLHIKVVMNKQKTKVLFAEAGSDFTDVLLSFLRLPLVRILSVLEKQYGDKAPVVGSLSTLYRGIVNLDSIHFQTGTSKPNLLFPTSFYDNAVRILRLNVYSPHPISPSSQKTYEGVYTESAASFIISDDLQVMPNVAGSFLNTLSNLGIAVAEMDGSVTRDVSFGFNEILALLRGLMVSRNPLTAFICGSQMSLASGKYEQGNVLLHQIDPEVMSKNTKKMILKVMIQKSDYKHGHVKQVRVYMVSDDLTVTPLAMTSCLSVLDGLKISVSDVEELELQVGLEEGLSIMRAALTSTMALTDGLSKHISKASLSSNSALTAKQTTLKKRLKRDYLDDQ